MDESEQLNQILEMDDIAEEGLFCVAPDYEDIKFFEEHAKKRLNDNKYISSK